MPTTIRSRFLSPLLAVAALGASATAGGVRIVDAPGLGTLPDVQSAIDAAIEGDTLVVAAGSYPGFVVDGKSLAIVAFPGAGVQIDGQVQVRNLLATQTVLLAGLIGTGRVLAASISETALVVSGCAGHVRVQGCNFTGGAGTESSPYGNGGHGAQTTASARVVLVGCTLRGGKGGGSYPNTATFGGQGGDGLRTQGSALAVYDCSLRGGAGGHAFDYAGNGGRGADVLTFGIFAAGATFQGGAGGEGLSTFGEGGDGGHGLYISQPAQAQLLGCTAVGGQGGRGGIFPGPPGQRIVAVGALVQHPGTARRFSGAGIAAEGGLTDVIVAGVPGDLVFLPGSLQPGWTPLVPTKGVWTVPFPAPMVGPLAVLPASGALIFQVGVPAITGGSAARAVFRQGYVSAGSEGAVLGSPLHLVAIDRQAPPDCNGNGVHDLVDLLEQTSPDCDANLVPDSCDPDCNGNGQPDACDILSGTSPDQNGNGVPDECEGPTTWHVDASAPAGGDGSAASPFRALSEAVESCIDGDDVLVRDGLYVGPQNRNVDLGSKSIEIRSQNGPDGCIVDCEGLGRAFFSKVTAGNGPVRIEGLTIRNATTGGSTHFPWRGGAIDFQRPGLTLVHCVFQGNFAHELGGGAVALKGGSLIESCTFEGNATSQGSIVNFGAAVFVTDLCGAPSTRIVSCRFVGNSGFYGGAVAHGSNSSGTACDPLIVSHSEFIGNSAKAVGGAFYATKPTLLDDVLFAGNTAGTEGGAVYTWAGGDLRISNATFSGNAAFSKGGALTARGICDVELENSVLWGNAAPMGAELAMTILGSGSPTISLSRCDLQGGPAAVLLRGGTLNWGAGCIDLDPAFSDPDGPDGNPLTFLDNDYRLGPGSPCVDAGDNALVAPDFHDLDGDGITSEPVPFDLDFLPRFVDDPLVPDTGSGTPPLVDMGAYERQP